MGPYTTDKHGQPIPKYFLKKNDEGKMLADNTLSKNSSKLIDPKDNKKVMFYQKPLTGFSGGYKVPEEIREKKSKMKYTKPNN